MSGNLQNYTKAVVYIEDALLSEETSVSVRRTTGSNPVMTTAKGYGGESPGAPMMEIDISNAVPSADFEMNPGKFMKLNQFAKITIFAAGKTLTQTCFIHEDNFSHGVGKEATLEFKCRGSFRDWE